MVEHRSLVLGREESISFQILKRRLFFQQWSSTPPIPPRGKEGAEELQEYGKTQQSDYTQRKAISNSAKKAEARIL